MELIYFKAGSTIAASVDGETLVLPDGRLMALSVSAFREIDEDLFESLSDLQVEAIVNEVERIEAAAEAKRDARLAGERRLRAARVREEARRVRQSGSFDRALRSFLRAYLAYAGAR